MTLLHQASIIAGYLSATLADGCVLVAATLAASAGGRPLLWGVSFGFWHAFYLSLGLVISFAVSEQSELFGHGLVLAALAYLVWHFWHHRLHHFAGGDCSCDDHPNASIGFIVSSAAALSLHATAGGAALRSVLETASTSIVAATILLSAMISGTFVALAVLFGDRNRALLMKMIDAAPGVTIGLLTAAMANVAWELAEHSEILDSSGAATVLFWALVLVVALSTVAAHYSSRRSPSQTSPLVAIRRGQ